VASIHDIFFGAEWHERETWEMYGFAFDGHPDLRHIYLPGQFEGFPLRKDFPLLAREVKPWPGLVDVEDLPPAEEARQDAAINAAQEADTSEGGS
jgi:NADH-quinone oxidoreductase subunit C